MLEAEFKKKAIMTKIYTLFSQKIAKMAKIAFFCRKSVYFALVAPYFKIPLPTFINPGIIFSICMPIFSQNGRTVCAKNCF